MKSMNLSPINYRQNRKFSFCYVSQNTVAKVCVGLPTGTPNWKKPFLRKA